ncbi:MAG: response regulator [Clostridiales bacterium]|jgi:PAS domain S-box-containing protein|nr:response regulator [Clostridiales bacterium]
MDENGQKETELTELSEVERLKEELDRVNLQCKKLTRQLTYAQDRLAHAENFYLARERFSAAIMLQKSREERYLNRLLTYSKDMILLVDEDGRVAYCTQSFLNLAGVSNLGLISGRYLADVYAMFADEEYVAGGLGRFEKAKNTRETVVVQELTFRKDDPSPRCYAAHITPLFDDKGVFDGAMMLYHDITDIKRAQEAAELANEAKSRFLASMSHEIRTPMNAILGMSDMMRTDNFDEKQKMFFSDIKKMSGTLLQIINDILDFSKIEAKKMEINPVHFNLRELCNNIFSVSQFTAGEKDLAFTFTYGENTKDVVYGDDVRIRQIITNILNNAIKYTKEGLVSFSVFTAVRYGKEYVAFVVADTGIGIKEADIDKLFSTFNRLDSGVNHAIAGTGLGLSITKTLVELMGGEVTVKSVYGQGSTFTVYLPLPAGDPAKIVRESALARVVVSKDAKILVVDDNQMNLKVALAYLAKHDAHPDTATDGAEAVAAVQSKTYDLVFMDHMMPVMDGVEATKAIRELEGDRYKKLPIVALSANAVTGAKELFLQSGMNDFISKPIKPSELNRALAQWLPPDKISQTAEKIVDPSLTDGEHRSDAAIDKSAGIENAGGDEEFYGRLVKSYKAEHLDDLKRIVDCLKRGDVESAHRTAHTLKSTARLIGAMRLGEAAFAVEQALAGGVNAATDDRLSKLKREFDAVSSALGAPEKRAAPKKRAKSGVDKAAADALAARLKPLLDAGDTDCLEMLDEVKTVFGHDGEPLATEIENFNFVKAAEILTALCK